jgi:hypothetical protein
LIGHTLHQQTAALTSCLSCRSCGCSGFAAGIASSFGFNCCNYFFKQQNHFNYALHHCSDSYFNLKYFHFKKCAPIDYHLTELSMTKSNWFQVLRYFYWLKPVYFENEIFEVSMIDHFMNAAIGNLYLCLNAMVSFFIIIAISESSDGVLPLSFNMLLMCFVCFKLDCYSW